jgi:hypothetical protein
MWVTSSVPLSDPSSGEGKWAVGVAVAGVALALRPSTRRSLAAVWEAQDGAPWRPKGRAAPETPGRPSCDSAPR